MKRLCAAAVLVLLAAGANPDANGRATAKTIAQVAVKNAGFEDAARPNDVPGWTLAQHVGPPSFEMGVDRDKPFAGKASFRIKRTRPQIFGAISQQVDVAAHAGKTVEFAAMMRTTNVGPDGWVLYVDVPGNRVMAKPVSGPRDWTEVRVKAPIPAGTKTVSVGALMFDDGTAWLDNAAVRIVE